jgi:hypothetical protein
MSGFALDAILIAAAVASGYWPIRWSAVPASIPSAFIGTYWYVRNYAETGNPLYNVQVAFGRHVLLRGTETTAAIAPTTLAVVINPHNPRDMDMYTTAIVQALGDWLPIVLSVGLCLAVSLFLRAERRGGALLAAGLIIATAITYWHTPYSGANNWHHGIGPSWHLAINRINMSVWTAYQMRYALPLLAVVSAMAAAGFSEALRISAAAKALSTAKAALSRWRRSNPSATSLVLLLAKRSTPKLSGS